MVYFGAAVWIHILLEEEPHMKTGACCTKGIGVRSRKGFPGFLKAARSSKSDWGSQSREWPHSFLHAPCATLRHTSSGDSSSYLLGLFSSYPSSYLSSYPSSYLFVIPLRHTFFEMGR